MSRRMRERECVCVCVCVRERERERVECVFSYQRRRGKNLPFVSLFEKLRKKLH